MKEYPMKKLLAVAALVTLAACGEKKAPMPAADTAAAAAPAPAADTTMKADSAMAGDTAHKM
jgi:predicted small lipoprotein YifL